MSSADWSDYWEEVGEVRFEEEPFNWRFYQLLLEDFDFSGKKVLEVGCGTGIDSIHMGLEGADISFLDQSKKALELVEDNLKRFSVEGNLIRGDAFEQDIEEEYDLVHSCGTVEHFTGDKRQDIVDIHARAVKKDGLVVLIVPNKRNLPYMVGKFLSEKAGRWVYGREHPYSRRELEVRMERAGLEVEKIIGGELFFSLLWFGAPIILNHGKLIRRGITQPAMDMVMKANYDNFLADRFGRVIGCVGRKK